MASARASTVSAVIHFSGFTLLSPLYWEMS